MSYHVLLNCRILMAAVPLVEIKRRANPTILATQLCT